MRKAQPHLNTQERNLSYTFCKQCLTKPDPPVCFVFSISHRPCVNCVLMLTFPLRYVIQGQRSLENNQWVMTERLLRASLIISTSITLKPHLASVAPGVVSHRRPAHIWKSIIVESLTLRTFVLLRLLFIY